MTQRQDATLNNLENSAEALEGLVYTCLRKLYGEEPHDDVHARVENELAIIRAGKYEATLIAAQKLMQSSLDAGYLAGARGLATSSFVAFLLGITDANPLQAHYRCPECKHTVFIAESGYGCGADLPDEICSLCGADYTKNGFDTPYQNFFGINGEKIPNIDLSFAVEYQPTAQEEAVKLFGKDKVFALHPESENEPSVVTIHFEQDALLKLRLLNHDALSMLKHMQDTTGVDPRTIPLDDPQTIQLICAADTNGVPEFGTKFMRELILATKPTTLNDLIRLYCFGHGADVWLNNANDLILGGTAKVREVISCRDDIFNYLTDKGMDEQMAYAIMDDVRKGRGLKPEWATEMMAFGVPDWYIESCQKIRYLSPRSHAVAYVTMAFRIAWFKAHHPVAFYNAYFAILAKEFDTSVLHLGAENVQTRIEELSSNPNLSKEDGKTLQHLKVGYEVCLCGVDVV